MVSRVEKHKKLNLHIKNFQEMNKFSQEIFCSLEVFHPIYYDIAKGHDLNKLRIT